jgi:osmoprotectant transport system ATP-binding protein
MIDLTEGDILLDGRSIGERDEDDLRREIGYVIQSVGLFPHRTIGENIATVPRLLGWDKRRTRARVAELLELIGLEPELADRYPAQLSGGQRQRVGVARALAVDPPLMLMDEPFGAIDPINRERLQNEFLRLQAQLRKTVVFVTHDIDEAIKMGDRIAIMQEGGVLAQYASPAELLMRPASPFVEDFVGADRALKRLALQRVRDVELAPASAADANGGVRVRLDDTLRDALSAMLAAEAQRAAAVAEDGQVAGALTIQSVAHALQVDPR